MSPREESNLDLGIRSPSFYPLNYRGYQLKIIAYFSLKVNSQSVIIHKDMKQSIEQTLEKSTGSSGHLASPQEIEQSIESAENIIKSLDSPIFNQMVEKGDIVIEKTTDSDGNAVSLTIKERGGEIIFFENIKWFDGRIARRERKISVKNSPDREATEDEFREAVETGEMDTLPEPENDPQKIN